MKKLVFLINFFLLQFALTFISCEKEKTIEELLIGKWDVVFERYTTYQNNVITSDDFYTNDPGDFILEFFKDGTGKFYEYSVVSSNFSWEVTSDEKLIVTYSSETPHEVEFTVNKNSLTWGMTISSTINGIEYKAVDYKECTRIKS